MEDKAIRGVPWALLSYASSKLITICATIVLAHLLVPDEFGLVALASLLANLLNIFSDLGLSTTLILRQNLEREAMRTIFSLMLILSVGLATAVTALSPLIADAFGEPRLAGVLAALSPIVILGGVNWFYEAVLQRELEFRRRFVALAAQGAGYAAVAIPLAALGAGVWSLVVGQLAASALLAAVLVRLSPYQIRPGFDRRVAREIVSTSRGFMAQGGVAFLSQNTDYLAVGKMLGTTQLGFYSMAYRLAELPYLGIADPIARVTFPAFARMRQRGEDIRPAFLSGLRLVALVACPIGVLLSATADPFTRAILGTSWLTMIGPLAVLGVWAAIYPVQWTFGWLLNSLGLQGAVARISFSVLLVSAPALFAAAKLGGLTAIAWTMLGSLTLSLIPLMILARRRGELAILTQLGALWPVLIGIAASWAAARIVADAMAGQAAGIALVASVGTGIAAYAATLFVVAPRLLGGSLQQARRALRPADSAAPETP